MKKVFMQFLQQPKIVIPVSVVVALIVGALSYNAIGRAPTVSFQNNLTTAGSSVSSTGSIELSFLKTGRLATLAVQKGDSVKKGEILATLDGTDVQGALNQAKGALELAKAQYASLNVQYANTKKTQDVLVANAHRTLLSSSLTAVAHNRQGNTAAIIDSSQAPQISGTYTCTTEGSYEVDPYGSGASTGYSFTYHGLEEGSGSVTNYTPQPLGTCGLFIQFPSGYTGANVTWVIAVPNTQSSQYVANKNAYDSAVATRDQVLKQLEETLGNNASADTSVAQATVDAAEGAYEVAQAAYNNTLIVAPADGTVSFVDDQLKVGQGVPANKAVITITR